MCKNQIKKNNFNRQQLRIITIREIQFDRIWQVYLVYKISTFRPGAFRSLSRTTKKYKFIYKRLQKWHTKVYN